MFAASAVQQREKLSVPIGAAARVSEGGFCSNESHRWLREPRTPQRYCSLAAVMLQANMCAVLQVGCFLVPELQYLHLHDCGVALPQSVSIGCTCLKRRAPPRAQLTDPSQLRHENGCCSGVAMAKRPDKHDITPSATRLLGLLSELVVDLAPVVEAKHLHRVRPPYLVQALHSASIECSCYHLGWFWKPSVCLAHVLSISMRSCRGLFL